MAIGRILIPTSWNLFVLLDQLQLVEVEIRIKSNE